MNRKKDIEQLFRQHYAKMYNLARCILSDDDESKDVVSEVFAQILADDVVLVPESEEGYLMRSVRNRCLNLIAHKSVKERVAKLLLDDADVILSEETDDFCVLFRLGFVLYFTRSGIQIHVLVDKMQKVVAV